MRRRGGYPRVPPYRISFFVVPASPDEVVVVVGGGRTGESPGENTDRQARRCDTVGTNIMRRCLAMAIW